MPRPLSETRQAILRCLAQHDWERDGCPSAGEISVACGRTLRCWANGPLREMRFDGLTEAVGYTLSGARTWRITDAGRAALDQYSVSEKEAG